MPTPPRPAKVVYVIGAGLSAGLEFPTISNLLYRLWPRLVSAGHADGIAEIIRFHHPRFDPAKPKTFPNIETLLSEMQANAALFDASRPATGGFTPEELERRQTNLLFGLATWFHELKAKALSTPPAWLAELVQAMRREEAEVISFNWDLVLDELLFGDDLDSGSYALGPARPGPRLIKPHGSLNWYGEEDARRLPDHKRFRLSGSGSDAVYAFRPYRAPLSRRHRYMPIIVPPVYAKTFDREPSRSLWREAVAVLGTATEVRFLGYSLPDADFHARFILRCGFHNQTSGAISPGGGRLPATGPARVTIVDPSRKAHIRIRAAVGRRCHSHRDTIKEWIDGGGLR